LHFHDNTKDQDNKEVNLAHTSISVEDMVDFALLMVVDNIKASDEKYLAEKTQICH
jgi:hypothetical protein